jgi:hypothetical protein
MLLEMRKTHDVIFDVWLEGKPPYVFDDPRHQAAEAAATRQATAGRATAPIETNGRQDGYPLRPPERIPSSRMVIGRDANGLEASFKAAWDDARLHILVDITDKTPMQNTQPPEGLWNGDGVELFIGSENIGQGGAMLFTDRQILLGARESGQFHMTNIAAQPDIKTAVVPNIDGSGYILEASIPWQALGVAPKENMTLLFDIAIDNSDGEGRNAQLMWNGGARNSADRSHWGRLLLVP